jgi:hypothetical protein
MTLSGFLWGMAIVAVGVGVTWKTEYIVELLGRNWWAEKTFGGGGSQLFYKLCGICISILGTIIAFDLFGIFFGTFILSLFPGGR